MFPMKRFLSLCVPLVLGVSAQAQFITGVADRTSYTDQATFTVGTNVGFVYSATLNGVPVPMGVSQTIRRMDYYDLLAQRTPSGGGVTERQLVRFIVLSSSRGSPERGLTGRSSPSWGSCADTCAGLAAYEPRVTSRSAETRTVFSSLAVECLPDRFEQ